MKREELIKHVRGAGGQFLREGGRHTIYVNPATKTTTAIPRHREIDERLVRAICRDLEISEP